MDTMTLCLAQIALFLKVRGQHESRRQSQTESISFIEGFIVRSSENVRYQCNFIVMQSHTTSKSRVVIFTYEQINCIRKMVVLIDEDEIKGLLPRLSSY